MTESPWLINSHIFTSEFLRGHIHDRKVTHTITVYPKVVILTGKKQDVQYPVSPLCASHMTL